MAVSYLCHLCVDKLSLSEEVQLACKPSHCYGSSNHVISGVLGGYKCSCPCVWEKYNDYPGEKESSN